MGGGRFTVEETPLAGLLMIKRKRLGDHRGFLTRMFEPRELSAFGWSGPVEQINETGTAKAGTVRGLHFQRPPFAEMKLVSCTAGRIFDVAVDLRVDSSTYLKWFGAELSAKNDCSLLIPEGFAHGFQALTDDIRMIYVHSAPHAVSFEGGVNALDPAIGINWPLAVDNRSERDIGLPLSSAAFEGIHI